MTEELEQIKVALEATLNKRSRKSFVDYFVYMATNKVVFAEFDVMQRKLIYTF